MKMPGDCFSCLFVYTVRCKASVYILLCAIYGFAAGLSKKAARKVAFNPLASHAINTLAKTTLGCDFYIQHYSSEQNVTTEEIHGLPFIILFCFTH